jgi:hypothetical protein
MEVTILLNAQNEPESTLKLRNSDCNQTVLLQFDWGCDDVTSWVEINIKDLRLALNKINLKGI